MYQVNGLKDIYTVLSNERKLGGVVETEYIRLRNGEEFPNAVITSLDMVGSIIYSVGFISEKGKRFIMNVDDISAICNAEHKKICKMINAYYKREKMAAKMKYFKRLCEINEGSSNPMFLNEVQMLVEDMGLYITDGEVIEQGQSSTLSNNIRIA